MLNRTEIRGGRFWAQEGRDWVQVHVQVQGPLAGRTEKETRMRLKPHCLASTDESILAFLCDRISDVSDGAEVIVKQLQYHGPDSKDLRDNPFRVWS